MLKITCDGSFYFIQFCKQQRRALSDAGDPYQTPWFIVNTFALMVVIFTNISINKNCLLSYFIFIYVIFQEILYQHPLQFNFIILIIQARIQKLLSGEVQLNSDSCFLLFIVDGGDVIQIPI